MEPASARGRPVVTKTVTKQRSWSVCASNCYAGETTANAVISPGVPEEGLEPSLPEGNRILSPKGAARLAPYGLPEAPV